jgi:hypothetical protein
MLSRNLDDKTWGQSLFPMKHGTEYNTWKKPEETPPFATIQGFHPHTSDMLCTNSACEAVFSGHNGLTAGLSTLVVSPTGGSSSNSTSGH